jgi:hypothetical protein
MKYIRTFESFLNESSKTLEVAEEKIDKLPAGKLFDDAKNIEKVFKKSKYDWNEVIVTYERHEDEHHIVVINLSELHITQPNIQANKVKEMLPSIDKMPRINVVQFSSGEMAIYDGHHRLIANWALGNKKIKVNLVKL